MDFTKTDYANAKRSLMGSSNPFAASNYDNAKRLLKATPAAFDSSCISKQPEYTQTIVVKK